MAESLVFTSAGTQIDITASAPATRDLAGYQAITEIDWIEIGECTDLGELGRVYELVTHNSLKNRRTVKRKGTYDDGSVTLQLGRVPSDTGQALLKTARDSDTDHYIRVTLQDATVLYLAVQILSYTTSIGGPNNIVGAQVQIEVTDDIFEV